MSEPRLRQIIDEITALQELQKSPAPHPEAFRDAISIVALAIVRRGDDPVLGWTVQDVITARNIAEQLSAL
jgi:hypothetical protein